MTLDLGDSACTFWRVFRKSTTGALAGSFAVRFTRRLTTRPDFVLAAQIVMNAVLLVAGVWLAALGNWRALFLLVLVPFAFVPFSYARLRLHRALEAEFAWTLMWPLTLLGLACDVVMASQLLMARQETNAFLVNAPGVMWVGSVWFSAHALLLVAYLIAGIARLAGRSATRVWRLRRRAQVAPPVPPRSTGGDPGVLLGRRQLLQRAGVLGAALPFGASIAGAPISYDFRSERREITLPHWPRSLDGLRVVHLSDIHVGGAMDRRRLLQVAELANQCQPDIVLHTGDFLTHRSGEFDAPLYEALARIQAPYGQWACLGNHDFEDAGRLAHRLAQSGVTVLRNKLSVVSIDGKPLEIGGIDYQFDRPRWSQLYNKIISNWGERNAVPRILLNHDPSAFRILPDNCADLVLSGHTHGGHIGVQLGPSHAITVVGLIGVPDQGVFHRGDMTLYVTRCVGFYGYPMRIGIPPEIALLVLRSPQSV